MGRPGSSAVGSGGRRQAAPPSRRVRPPASIALDRNHGQPLAGGHGRWQGEDAPSACAASLASSAALPHPPGRRPHPAKLGGWRPYDNPYVNPYVIPCAASGVPFPAWPHLSWSCPLGGWCGQAEWMRFARLIHRPGRVLGGPAVRAAFGGNLSRTCLPRRVVPHASVMLLLLAPSLARDGPW